MAGAVVVSAIALLLQLATLFGILRVVQTMRDRVLHMLPKVEGLVDASRVAVDESRAGIAEVREKSNEILDQTQKQLHQVEGFLAETTERTRKQLDHAEVVIQDALERVEETVALVHKGILKPVRGITGIVSAVRTVLQVLTRGDRPSPDRVTVDEEMFI